MENWILYLVVALVVVMFLCNREEGMCSGYAGCSRQKTCNCPCSHKCPFKRNCSNCQNCPYRQVARRNCPSCRYVQ